jgi:hypothetical protein
MRFKTVERFHSATNFCDRLKCIALGMLYAQFNEFYLNREKKNKQMKMMMKHWMKEEKVCKEGNIQGILH